ncbi:SUMF1/EgtB/PvdO family nonheme iron enzyme [uncultured Treponema sp.]|uniref:formylglycine-generating enzyme family protein n=1 Tax=uncultured Treponema sp. TaxID=162155 RepID=UPI00258AF8C2|nr:SUMF1/EgtB/PvdO family nonheme iron enzyme [uncultured Treponema sp.]
MKSLKKCFSLGGGRKNGLSFATFVICGIMLLVVPLQISCSDSGDDNEDSTIGLTIEGWADVDKFMIAVPGKDYSILATEVTQGLYESVMGENPSEFKGEKDLPVENVNWYDAVVFCNKLSEQEGLEPVYSVDGKTDTKEWGYSPHNAAELKSEIKWNKDTNGYRLPTVLEWQYAARGGENYKYSGSDNLNEVGWYSDNSGYNTYPVAQKKPNGYGLYDMSGNVQEWCWSFDSDHRGVCGGSCHSSDYFCKLGLGSWCYAYNWDFDLGFRIVRSTGKK